MEKLGKIDGEAAFDIEHLRNIYQKYNDRLVQQLGNKELPEDYNSDDYYIEEAHMTFRELECKLFEHTKKDDLEDALKDLENIGL
jgi:hypothetical protein